MSRSLLFTSRQWTWQQPQTDGGVHIGASLLGEWNSQQRLRKTCLRRLGGRIAEGRFRVFACPGARAAP